MRSDDERAETCVFEGMQRRASGAPCVVAALGNTQHATQRRNAVLGLLRPDERESHRFSLAKKAAAFFNISRSSLRTRFSLRSRESSSRSSLVSAPAGPRPASISACFTQAASADGVRSRSRATSATVLLLD